MDIDKLQKTSTAIDETQWETDIPNLPGISLQVRSMSAPTVAKALGRALRKAEKVDDVVPDAVQEEIDNDIIATHVLVDWKGFTEGDKTVPYSPEKALELLTSSIFRAGVNIAAARAAQRMNEQLESLAKNSVAPSKQ